MDDELELLLKSTIEALDIVDDVILDFQEKLKGDSAIIISIDKINQIEPHLQGQGQKIQYQGTIFGIWKADGNPTPIIESRNNAIQLILSRLSFTVEDGVLIRVLNCDKNVWVDKTNDNRYYFTFQMIISLEKKIVNVR